MKHRVSIAGMARLAVLVLFAAAPLRAGTALDEALLAGARFDYAEELRLLGGLSPEATVLPRAWAHLGAGETDRALELFLSAPQGGYEALFGTGLVRFLQGDYAAADTALSECLDVNPQCAAAAYLRGEAWRLAGDPGAALEHYRAALKLDYNLTEARLGLARALEALGDHDDAFRQWARVRSADPENPAAAAAVERLKGFISRPPAEIMPRHPITEASVLTPVPDSGELPVLRIGLATGLQKTELWGDGGLEVYVRGEKVSGVAPGETLTLTAGEGPLAGGVRVTIRSGASDRGIVVRDLPYAQGFAWGGIADREYRGTLEVIPRAGGFALVNLVNIDEYLYSVLPSEMIGWWPTEALKVQAVLARTQVVYRRRSGLHRAGDFDLCDSQHCQVYKGVKQEVPRARTAVDATRGEILVCDGRPVHALFSSNCSGHTRSCAEIRWGDESFLQAVPDTEGPLPRGEAELHEWLKHPPAGIFCGPSKYTYYAESRWMRAVSQEDLAERLNRSRDLGRIRRIVPVSRSASGHINGLRIEGTRGSVLLQREYDIRRILLGRIRSANFIVRGAGDDDGVPEWFVFWGGGWGHAVGLCQSGAVGMVSRGYTYDAILKKYYAGSEIRDLDR